MAEQQESRGRLLGRTLRHMRMFHGISATDIDGALGWRTGKTTDIERGLMKPNYDDLLAYSNFFGLSVSEVEAQAESLKALEEGFAQAQPTSIGGKTSSIQTLLDLREDFRTPLEEADYLVGSRV